MLANRTQRWWAIGAAISVVLLAASWFLLIGPKRGEVADLNSQVEQLQSSTGQQKLRTAQLQAALAQLPKRKAELAAIQAQLPPTAGIPKAITDLEGYAAAAGVSLDQFTPGTPTVADGATAPTSASATNPVLVQVPISVQATGDYFESSLFLKSLQTTMSRAILIQSIQLAESSTPAAPASTDATPATPGATSAATGNPAATPAAGTAGTSGTAATSKVSMTMTGKLFVLLDGTDTLADVKKDAIKATS